VQQLQQQRCSNWRVTTEMDFGQDDTAIPFAADRRAIVAHADRDIDFPNRRPYDGHLRRRRYVFHDPARRQVRDDRTGTVSKYQPSGKGKSKIFTYRLSDIRHERQPINVGIDSKPNRGT
jgi:hypothetical protein